MKKDNPFTFSFGKKPVQYISRMSQTSEVMDSFEADNPMSQVFMVTGVRGTGKTVFMTSIAGTLREKEEWLVVDLNPERSLLESAAAKLYDTGKVKHLFLNADVSISIFGLQASAGAESPAADVESALELMLRELQKQGKKVLFTLDEVDNNAQVREFVSSFQIMLRQDLPIYLLMTGLYDNIYNLQNEHTLTFLYRAPKIVLSALNLTAISNSYSKIFQISFEEAAELAALTKGYPFAYQVLGYLLWESGEPSVTQDILSQYDQYLEEYVYEKLYSETSEKDRVFLRELAQGEPVKTSELLERTGMKKNDYSVYRERLKKKGLIDTEQRGYISMRLPRFAEYLCRTM